MRRLRDRGLLLLALVVPPVARCAAQSTWPSRSERSRGWREDLDSTITQFLPLDRSFDPAARARFTSRARQLRDSVELLTDPELVTRLAAAVAGAHNAHTRLYLLRNRTVLRRYPVRVWWFRDGLYIVRAHAEFTGLLGDRVIAIAGHPVAEAARRVAPLYAADRSWARYLSSYLLTSPEILQGVGLLRGADTLSLTVQGNDGRRTTMGLPPMPLERTDQPTEAWWDLGPGHPGHQGPWISVLGADTLRLPRYLRGLARFYWMERDTTAGLLYVQYNRAQDQPDVWTVKEFGDSLLDELRRDPPRKLVIDLRFNTGGDLGLTDSLFRRIAALPLAREPGRLFVITGRATFSAGITPVALLRQLTRVTIVGEPVGDGLDFWAEGGNVLLHNTGLTLHYANGFHSYSPREHPAFRPYWYDLSVHDIGPDIPVEVTWRQYLSGRDPALEAISHVGRRASPDSH